MTIMKKLFSVLVAMTMVFSLAACGGNPSSVPDGGRRTVSRRVRYMES